MTKYSKLLVYSLAVVLIAACCVFAFYTPDVHSLAQVHSFKDIHLSHPTALAFGPMIMTVTLADLDKPRRDNTGGIQTRFYLGILSDVYSFPDMPAYSGNMADLATISGNITMKTGKRLYEIACVIEKGSVGHELQGAVGGHSFRNKFTFQLAENSPEHLGLLRILKNEECFVIPAEFDNTKRIVGHPGYPATLESITGGTGEGTAGEKMSTIVLAAVNTTPAPVWTGKIDLQGGTGYGSGETYDFQTLTFVAD